MEQGKTEGKNYGSQRLLDTKEAAEFLQVSERHLWTISETGLIPRIKMGRCVRYKMDDLVRYIDGLRSESINRNLMKKGAA
jgi:predicted DNA-binding transcriptional regulator AlpA